MRQVELWDGRYARDGHADGPDDAWIAAHSDLLQCKRGSLYVDLGCGAGGNACYLYDNGYDVVACDFSEEALRLLKGKRPDIQTRCFDMLDGLPFLGGEIGVVVASLSLHYFPWAHTLRIMERIHDVLEEDGLLFMRVNGVREYAMRDRLNTVQKLEENYYLMRDGATKRYFDERAAAAMLAPFSEARVTEGAFEYHGHTKHYLECVARR